MPSQASSQAATPPSFACRIPAELLPHDEKERRFYTQSDVMDQKMDWLLKASISQSQTLAEVNGKATVTNGKIAQAVRDIEDIRAKVATQAEEAAPVVKAYGIAKKLAASKVFWIGAAAFVLVGLPALVSVAPAPLAFLRAAVTVLLGV